MNTLKNSSSCYTYNMFNISSNQNNQSYMITTLQNLRVLLASNIKLENQFKNKLRCISSNT
ncbi:hypothetical protein ACFX5K_01695 [Rickettsiales bacterium LUAb2]